MNFVAVLFFVLCIFSCLYVFLPFKKRKACEVVQAGGTSRNISDRSINPLDVKTTACLKGIFAIGIVLHHFAVHFKSAETWDFVQIIFTKMGAVAVGVFFMLSAFGLMQSYKKNGTKYLKKMLLVKIPVLYLLYVVVNAMYLIERVSAGANFGTWGSVTRILGLDFLNNWSRISANAWFIFTIIMMYLLFIIVLAATRKLKHSKHINLAIITALTIAIYLIVDLLHPFNISGLYVRAIFCFPLGMAYATYYEKINRWLKKFWYIPFSMAAVLMGIDFFIISFPEQLRCLVACVFVISFISKLDIRNRIAERIGLISLEIYLLHGLFLILCDQWVGRMHQFEFTTLALILSIVASIILYYAQVGIGKLIKLVRRKQNHRKQTISLLPNQNTEN